VSGPRESFGEIHLYSAKNTVKEMGLKWRCSVVDLLISAHAGMAQITTPDTNGTFNTLPYPSTKNEILKNEKA